MKDFNEMEVGIDGSVSSNMYSLCFMVQKGIFPFLSLLYAKKFFNSSEKLGKFTNLLVGA